MEELQDALEDAQYVNAINLDDGPRPLVAWEKSTEAELDEWKSKLLKDWASNRQNMSINVPNVEANDDEDGVSKSMSKPPWDPEPLSYEWILSTSLGLFMFAGFIKENTNDYFQINFIEEILRWRYLLGRSRGAKLRKIYKRYLSPCGINPETNQPIVPNITHIEECDLEYIPNGPKLSQEELQKLLDENVDSECSQCCIGIDGPLRSEIVVKIEEIMIRETATILTEPDDYSLRSSMSSTTNQGASKPQLLQVDSNEGKECANENGISPDDEHGIKSKQESKDNGIQKVNLAKVSPDIFDKFEQVMIESIRLKHWQSFKDSLQWDKLIHYLWHKDRKTDDQDYFLMRVLGRGGFGLVTACKKGTTGTLYAMKVMNKKRIKAKKSEKLALNERACLAAVDSPFVVNLKYSFQTKDDLYLILDLMTGGDLSFHLSQKGRFGKEECLYYSARIMLGLQALHDKNYVYRDLKPENLLLAEDGRVRITDLGLATQVTPRLHGAAGTRGYWAPEMLRRNEKGKRMNYDQRVDWFSFGCVVAEMICGCNPFRSETALKFGLQKTESKEKSLDYATLHMEPSFESKKFSKTSIDLCKRLLDKDPDTRIGAKGCEEIMAHPWFKDTNWEMIISDHEKPPFIPLKDINAASQSEIGTFAEDRNAPKLTEEDQHVYANWDWTSKRVFAAEVIDMLIYERETGRPLIPLAVGGSCCCTVM